MRISEDLTKPVPDAAIRLLLVGVLVFASAGAKAQGPIGRAPIDTFDLAVDWSDVVNPNGAWSCNEGANPLVHRQFNWGGVSGETFWCTTSSGTYPPAWCKAVTSYNPPDWQPGDVIVHSTTQGSGYGLGNVTWTAPLDGTISISGLAWDAYHNSSRDDTWRLLVNDTIYATRSSIYGIGRTDPEALFEENLVPEMSLDSIEVLAGDVLTFEVSANTHYGHFVGVDMQVAFTPGSETAFVVIGHEPSGLVSEPVTAMDVTFNREIDPNTFTVDDIEMTGPSGPISVDPPVDQGGNVWRISFAEQSSAGEYHVLVGPHIEDLDGNEMDQDEDGVAGEEPDDVYGGVFTVQLPPTLAISITVDNAFDVYVSTDDSELGVFVGSGSDFWQIYDFHANLVPDVLNYIHIVGIDYGWVAGCAGVFELSGGRFSFENGSQQLDTAQLDYWLVSRTGFGQGYEVPTRATDGVWHQFLNDFAIWTNNGHDTNTTRYFSAMIVPVTALRVLNHEPSDVIATPIAAVDMTLSREVDPTTFTGDDVAMAGPGGSIAVEPPVDQGGNVWRINFPEQSAEGEYCLSVGPHIEDLEGVEMDQDGDGTPGEEPDDVYVGCFTIDMTAPEIVDQMPDGEVDLPVDHFDVTFSEEVTDATCDPNDILLAGPEGDIPVDAPVELGGNVWRLSFDEQTAEGDYTLAIAPCFEDLAGNPMADPYIGGFTIVSPNVVVSNANAPSEAGTGQQVVVTWTVTNEGTAPAIGDWQDCVYLSDDDQIGGDTLLGCADRPSELSQGEFYDGSATVTIPDVEEGDYCMIIRVDDGDALPESDETDNAAIVCPITISQPNLTISDLETPAEAIAGQPIDVGWRVTNTGIAPAVGDWEDCVYLSDDDQIGGDTPLGCLGRPTELDPNELYDRVATVTVPAVPEGQYWIYVCADNDDSMPETDEADNCIIDGPFPIYVTPCADLEPSNLVIPTEPVAAGDTAYVDWTVTNIGTGATSVPFWHDRIHLSVDQTLGESVWSTDIQNPMALNPGESYQQESISFTVPSALAGDYYVIVKTDARGQQPECDENNNVIVSGGVLHIEHRIPPILTMTDCAFGPDAPWPGDTVTVSWTITNSGEMPTGPFTIDHAIVFSEDDVLDFPGDQVLAWHVGDYSGNLDTGETSGLIEASVDIPLDVWGAYQIIVWPDPPLWVDLDRSPCSVPITVQTGLPADLEVDQVTAPPTAYSGQPVDITWTVRNATVEPTHVSWWDDRVYLSVDDNFETTGDNTLLGTFRHNGILSFDETYTGPEQGEVVLPPDLAEASYYVFIQVDISDRVYEGEWEDNNVGMAAGMMDVTYAPPDLVVDTVIVLNDGAPAVSVLSGTSVTVEWTVSNTGDGDTPESSWSDRIYVSADDVLDDGDPVLATAPHSGALGAGDAYTASRTITIPIEFGDPNSDPDVYVFVCTDVVGQVHESDPNNNCSGSDSFEVVWAPPDLQVDSVIVDTGGGPAVSGSIVTVEWTVVNDYIGATPIGSWDDRIYISYDDVLDGSDWGLATEGHSGVLDPGDLYTASRDVKIPIDYAGPDIHFFVKTDHDNRVYESDNANNVGGDGPIEVEWGLPDLTVQSISSPGGAVAGEPLTLSWTARNTGGPTQSGSWHDRVYLSSDRWLSVDDTAFDPPIEHVGDLAYDATYVANATIDLPPDLADQFYLIVESDSEDVVSESDDANNTRYVSISLTPLPVDLQLTNVDAPDTALSGQNMQVSWTVANFGAGATVTGSWRDVVYLSPDQYLDPGSDYYLGYFNHSGILNPAGEPGDSYTQTKWIQVPSGLSGPYYVFIVTDINGQLYEENDTGDAEENNVGFDGIAVQVEIPPPADLVVTDIVVPATGTLGENVNIQWTVENQGDFQAQGSWRDSLYISADTTWDIDDKYIGKVQRAGPLDPSDSYTESVTAPLPGVVPENYYIVVRTDIHNEVRESIAGEQNNTTASAGQINVICWVLALGGLDDSHELSTGTEHYFRIPDVPGGEDLLITLDCNDDSAVTELYVRYDAVPDRGHYDVAFSTPFAADHEIVVPSTQAGDYYVLVRGDNLPGGPSPYTVANRLLEFEIRSITPDQAGNAGSVTALIEGGRLSADTVARLVAGDTVIEGTTWPETTPTQMFVTFDLSGALPDHYDVEIEKPDEAPIALPAAFEVVEGSGPSLEVHLLAPSTLRTNRPYIVYIEYGNTGDADLPAPLFSLSAPDGVPLRLDLAEDPWPGPVQVLGISMQGPPELLRPGVWQHIPIYSRSPGTPGELEIALGLMTADATPIDWVEIEDDLRPDDIPDELWAALWANLTTGIGATWADFLAAMNDAATFLARADNRTYDVRELFAVAIKNAGGDLAPRLPLAMRVDAFSPAPGLPLVFVPVAMNNLAQRFHTGPLGRGWSHNYEYSLTRVDEDNVLVSGPGGSARSFTKQPDDSWQGSPGDYGLLEDLGGDTYQITEKSGLVWFFDATGKLAYVEEPNGNRITLSYSGDLLVETSHSNGHQLTLEYNPDDRIHWLTDHVGRQTEFIYDGATGEHLVQVIAAGSRQTFYEYNPVTGTAGDHALNSTMFPDGTHRYYGYDAQGRIAEVSRDAGAERFTFTYGDLGTVRVTDADGAVSTLWLGPNGELRTAEDALGNRLQLGYDENLNLVRLTAPDGAEYEFNHDSLGNPVESVDPLDGVISLGHTVDPSRLDWLRDARDNLIDFNSDGQGNLVEIVHPDTSAELFSYDSRGAIVTVMNRRGQVITYTHDPEGRLTRKVLPACVAYPAGRTIDYGYDARGNLESLVDSLTGAIALEWDDRDFLARIEYPGGIWFTFEYNDAGWRTRRTGHDGFVLNYGYDETGRLETLTDGDGGQIIQYGFNTVGRLVREDKGNGTYTMYEYDATGQILHLANYAPDDSVQSRFDYEYDENSNPISMATLAGTSFYGYDATGQLTDVTYPDGRNVTYEYDLAGNRVTVTDDGVPTVYATNELNQYTQVGDATYGYDTDGNMTSKTDATGTTLYEYDVENRLVRVVAPTDGTWEYEYDGLGNRIAVAHDGVVTSYAHDPIGLVDIAAEYDPNGVLAARCVHGIGLVALLDPEGTGAYFAYDATGHTRQLTDEWGVVSNTYNYGPFGMLLTLSEERPNAFRYVGRFGVLDDGNGLNCMRARQYHPSIGRFLTIDRLRLAGGDTNMYRYVYNSPLIFVDPSGDSLITVGLYVWVTLHAIEYFTVSYWHYVPQLWGFGSALVTGARPGLPDNAGAILGVLASNAKDVERLLTLATDAVVLRPMHRLGMFGQSLANAWGRTVYNAAYWWWTKDLPDTPSMSLRSVLIRILGSVDPNEKLGPVGSGEQRFVPVNRSVAYRINFENLPDATAPAQQVSVADELSQNLDWRTFQLAEIAFGDTVVDVPELSAHFVGEVELDNGLIVEIEAGLNIQTGMAEWTLTAIDPDTGEPPEDPNVGLLPPNDPNTHDGEGYVTFQIRPQPDAPTGTEVTNLATIIFDTNPPIVTNEVFNTIDSVAPDSSITGPSGEQPEPSFDVTWAGSDDDGGSGVATYSIYYRMASGSYTLWLTTPEVSAAFTAPLGGVQYDFYSVATDGAGNTESPPPTPDTTVNAGAAVPPAPALGAATAATIQVLDLGDVNASFVEHAVYEETTGQYVGEEGRLVGAPFWQPLDQWTDVQVRALSASTAYSFASLARSASGSETPPGPASPITTSRAGDVNGDNHVNNADLDLVRAALRTQYGDAAFDARTDLNADDKVTYVDLGIVRRNLDGPKPVALPGLRPAPEPAPAPSP